MIGRRAVATVAMNLRPRQGPWGGANQWARQVAAFLRASGYRVRFDLRGEVDLILMTHTGLCDGVTFLHREVGEYKKRRPQVRCLHRINDNDVRKGTAGMDALLAEANRVADHTVFVSRWLLEHHGGKWFDKSRPHSVIEPGADPAIFHPVGNRLPEGVCRVVTHHWSDNWAKGFDIYRKVDTAIADGLLEGFELHVIGRWPKEIGWRAAKLSGPLSGRALAERLRGCHIYLSASRWEPGPMHVAEGLQCGLPLVYHRDTGGTVEVGRRYGVEVGEDVVPGLLEARRRLPELRRRLLESPPSGDWMALEYRRLVQRMLCGEG